MSVLEQEIKREVEEALRELPLDKMGEVLDFILFLKERHTEGELQEASGRYRAISPLRTMPASHLDHLTGLVEWGGDAFADSERVYDDSLYQVEWLTRIETPGGVAAAFVAGGSPKID